MSALHLTVADQANTDERDWLRDHLRAFNAHLSPYLHPDTCQEPVPLDVFLRDAEGQPWGGLMASTYWRWLDIVLLWVHDDLRGQGHGRALLQRAEEEARRRDCLYVRVNTLDTQAPGFYQKLGYRIVGQFDDYPPGNCAYLLRKDLLS
jgi:ribosomal protein S18 acetylase RimI-like enzyme